MYRFIEFQLFIQVDLPEVMKEVHRRMRTNDPVFLGFLAPLSYMVNLYRWGSIPATDQERKPKMLQFPEALWTPFKTVRLENSYSSKGLVIDNREGKKGHLLTTCAGSLSPAYTMHVIYLDWIFKLLEMGCIRPFNMLYISLRIH